MRGSLGSRWCCTWVVDPQPPDPRLHNRSIAVGSTGNFALEFYPTLPSIYAELSAVLLARPA